MLKEEDEYLEEYVSIWEEYLDNYDDFINDEQLYDERG